jgi:hypothetical protein
MRGIAISMGIDYNFQKKKKKPLLFSNVLSIFFFNFSKKRKRKNKTQPPTQWLADHPLLVAQANPGSLVGTKLKIMNNHSIPLSFILGNNYFFFLQ